MNENVGASFGLSFLIVGFFAVALYQPDKPPPPVAAVPAASPVEPVEAHPPEAVTVRPVAARPRERAATVARPVSHRPTREVVRLEPRGVFTRVRDGETLADVALRVYGAESASGNLWAANRDLLDRPDAPLSAGSVLRTP